MGASLFSLLGLTSWPKLLDLRTPPTGVGGLLRYSLHRKGARPPVIPPTGVRGLLRYSLIAGAEPVRRSMEPTR